MLSSEPSSLTRSHWTQLESGIHRMSALQLPTMVMLGKEQLSGLCVCPECLRLDVYSHLRSRFTLLFHCGSLSPLCYDPALSVFASKCQSECHAMMAALCDLGDLGWGIPGFRIELFLHLEVALCDFVGGLVDDF